MANLLGVLRLSQEREPSTSPARQREHIQRYAETHGHRVVGWAEDLGVSGSVDPWERPELGPWLRGERESFDVLCSWRIDRMTRRVIHFARLLEWASEHGKSVVSASEGFDLATPMGRLFAHIVAALAEGELEAIRERQRDAYAHIISTGRHRGGHAPFGYVAVAATAPAKGYVLDVDPESSALVREWASRVIGGESLNALVSELNAAGVLTPVDRQRVRSGKEPRRGKWRVGVLSKLLRSDTLRGYMDPPVIGEDGIRLRRAPAVLDDSTWGDLQAELSARGDRKPRPRTNSAMLRRVARCDVCGSWMYIMWNSRGTRYYRCASKASGGTACGNGLAPADWLDETASAMFLEHWGPVETTETRYIPGESHAAEIREATEALERLTDRLETLTGAAADVVARRMQEHAEHIERLRSLPERPDQWVEEPTGMTFRDVWDALSGPDRGDMLRNTGVRVTVLREGPSAVLDMSAGDWSTGPRAYRL